MKTEGNKAVIGAFVVGALVLAVAGIMIFGSGAFFNDRETCVMYFDGDLKGLNVGAPVAFRGVRVGQVTDIKVYVQTDTLAFSIPVLAEIDTRRFHGSEGAFSRGSDRENLEALIDKGLRAQLALQSIVTGQLLVQMDIYPDAPLNLKGRGGRLEIPTLPSKFERLTRALEEISFPELVDNINKAVTQIGGILDKKEIENLFASIQTAANEITLLAQHLDEETRPMIRNLDKASQGTDAFVRKLDKAMVPVLTDAGAAFEAMRLAMAQAERTLQSIDALSAGYDERSAFRYEISNALSEIAAAANSLRALSDLLQQQPEALIRGKSAPGGS